MLNDIIGSQGDLLSNSTSKVDKSKDNDASIIKITQSHARSIIQENINEANTDSNMEKDTIEEDFCNLNNYDKPLETNLETYRMEVISTLDSFREIQINLKEKRMLLKTIYTSRVTIAQLTDENKLEMMTTRKEKSSLSTDFLSLITSDFSHDSGEKSCNNSIWYKLSNALFT